MDWLATLGAAAITGVLALAGSALRQTTPRELRRARQLSIELEAMDADSPSARLVEAARDDLVATSVIRTTISPWSFSRGTALTLIGASLTLAVFALIPMVSGILATANGEPDDAASLLTLMLVGSAGVLLLLALIPSSLADRRLRRLRRDVRAAWGLPEEMKMIRFSDPIPSPPQRPETRSRRKRNR